MLPFPRLIRCPQTRTAQATNGGPSRNPAWLPPPNYRRPNRRSGHAFDLPLPPRLRPRPFPRRASFATSPLRRFPSLLPPPFGNQHSALGNRRFRVISGSFWGRFGVVSGSFWGRFGVGLGSVWGRFLQTAKTRTPGPPTTSAAATPQKNQFPPRAAQKPCPIARHTSLNPIPLPLRRTPTCRTPTP